MKKVVLVIDDNRVSRLLPGLILQSFSEQIKVLECERGSDGLRLLESETVSHLLLDISMPDFDGIQVARAISDLSQSESMRLIAYTADVRAIHDDAVKSAGFDEVLLKPIKSDDLMRVLDLWR